MKNISWASIPEIAAYRIVLVLSVLFSILGILVAHYFGQPTDGGRGGALGVALSFFALFSSRGFGDRILSVYSDESEAILLEMQKLISDNDPINDLQNSFDRRIRALRSKLHADAASQSRQNMYLSWSAGISTIFWGFGDWFVLWLW